jgi:putative membrane protein
MTATQSNLAGLSRFIFRAPRWYSSLAFALLIAAMAGVAAFESGLPERSWSGLFILGRDAWEGIFFIGIPTVIAAFGTTGVDRFVGGRLTPNRSSLLALACEVIIVAVVTVAATVSVFLQLGQGFVFNALIVALASVFALRLLVIMAVSRSSMLVASIPASIQTVASAALLFVYSGTLRFLEIGGPLLDAYLVPYAGQYLARPDQAPAALSAIQPSHFSLLAVMCVIYATGVYVFLYVVDRPWRNSLGVSVLDFIRGFIGHIAEGSRELEDFFEQLGQEAVVPVTVLSFRRDDGDGDEKARFVLPMIHPGPMGEIGGGNFPERAARRSEGLAFPPHATAGHDFNLVTEREVDTILDAADDAAAHIEYTSEATTSVRTESGEANMLGQAFGDDAMLVSSYAPAFADDVEYGVGLAAATEARTHGWDDVLLVDAHNSNNGLDGPDLGHVTPGSQRSFDMIRAAGLAGETLADAERGDLSLGTAWDPTDWTPHDGVGPLGIRVAVTEVAGQTTAYVLVDGNNMDPGLRDRIVTALTDQTATDPAEPQPVAADGAAPRTVDAAEVMTTDTHIVNTVEAENQIGAAIDHDELLDLVSDLVAEARADCEPVTGGMAVEEVTVTIFGNDRTETLASHANVAVSMGGAFAAAVILSAMAVSVLIFFLA